MKAAALVREAARALRTAGIAEAERDAERLLRHVVGWDQAMLVSRAKEEILEGPEACFRGLVDRRARRVPLQHLLGTQAFWRHHFLVTADVLVPRPETEILVEKALELLGGRAAPVVVDVGTGSGCIALSIAAECRDARVHATDVSEPALAVARANAVRLRLEHRVDFRDGDLLEPVAFLRGAVDLVASNPPYVATRDRESLAPEVRDHEPALALFAGEDGLDTIRRLVPAAARVLRPGGALLMEIGAGQSEAVAAILAGALADASFLPDLQGIPRVALAFRR